jgi:DNA helicase II / ATP-dependent DNA helicase PcrA
MLDKQLTIDSVAVEEDVYTQRYRNLNEQQQQAVDTLEGPLLVVAGPGSGKTELLSLRVANILRQQDVAPANILCLTYTEAAATNMRQRLATLIGHQAFQVSIHTFHSFSTEIINRYPEYFYNGATFKPADELTQIEILDTIFSELPYHNPLSGKHQQAYTYMYDVRRAIGDIKKAGLTPEEFLNVIETNATALEAVAEDIETIFTPRVSRQTAQEVEQLITKLAALSEVESERLTGQLGEPRSILHKIAESLQLTLVEVQTTGKNSPLSEWKRKHLTKDSQDRLILKDALADKKLRSLQQIAVQYREQMREQGYFDFDDMLLDVLQVLEQQSALRYALQEQYQYVLVDEFQDTNDAQMRLIRHITDAPLYEGRPNIMAVGDDDQAIYKFQGAKISNIRQFRQHYRDVAQVVMVKNYRSGQTILDVARQVILQGEDRLENYYPDIVKELEAAGQQKSGTVSLHKYVTREHEFVEVAEQIRTRIEGGESPDSIAIIARRHRDLEDMSRHLERVGVPVRYDRQRNVLQEPHIHQLIMMAKFVLQLSRHQQAEADELLPEILSYPFWGLNRDVVWGLSVAVVQASEPSERLWLRQMEVSPHPLLPILAAWFKELRVLAETEPLESMLEKLIGAHTPLLPADVDADDGTWMQESPAVNGFTSPFKNYYFDELKRREQRSQYINFLSSLQVFIQALRAYRQGQPLKLADIVAFVQIHEDNNLPVTDTTPYASGEKAVQLLTAHGAKGLEFDVVYLLSCHGGVWTPSDRGNKLSFPLNLPISSEADNRDDMLRIFYVALTRARQELHLSSCTFLESGKEVQALEFLAGMDAEIVPMVPKAMDHPEIVLAAEWETYHLPPLVASEKALLLPIVQEYKLSLTHLNDFLDVTRGGPQTVLEQHLLRFPQPTSLAQAYGVAVHKSLQDLFYRFRYDTVLPSIDFLLESFRTSLEHQRVGQKDFDHLWQRGQEDLQLYYDSKSSFFNPQDLVERNFSNQQVMVGEACLTGKIDRIVELQKGRVSVHDIKTGKPSVSWAGKDSDQKIKLDKYRRQLLFYKLLVENSRDYRHLSVDEGVLEFVQSLEGQFIELRLPVSHSEEELEQLRKLIQVVYHHIVTLDFPDVSSYSQDYKGYQQFIEDLLAEEI